MPVHKIEAIPGKFKKGKRAGRAKTDAISDRAAQPDFRSDSFNRQAERAILSCGLIGPRDRK